MRAIENLTGPPFEKPKVEYCGVNHEENAKVAAYSLVDEVTRYGLCERGNVQNRQKEVI